MQKEKEKSYHKIDKNSKILRFNKTTLKKSYTITSSTILPKKVKNEKE